MSNWMSRAALLALLGMSSSVFATDPVGRLGGSFAVTPSGQASYEIPVALPAGAAGMTPSLSLRYSSSTAMGLAGVGWGLSGLSAITRCSHTKVLDGAYNVDVTLTATDKLCLDGQRLLSGGAANNQTSAGWLGTATVYTTQLQGFQKITATIDTANQQPQQFTVVTKDGRTLTYGGNTNTRIVASPRYDNATFQEVPSAQVLSWLLTRVQDRDGNTISYSYDVDAASSSAVLSAITYTSNATSSPVLAPRHVVAFDYTTQHVMPFTYVAGSRVRNSKLLTAIRISSGDVNGQNVTEVRRYTLSYRATTSQLTKRPLLASVQQCETRGGTQQCLKPTTFTWKDAVPEFNHEIVGPAWADSPGTNSTRWYCAGSPSVDYCANAGQVPGTADTWNGDASYYSTIRYGDIDGDGKADICGRTSAGMECHLSTGNGFASAALSAPAWSNANGWNQEKYYATIQFADINGDGKADLCGRGANGLLCYPSLGASGFDTTPVTLADYTDAAGWGDTGKHYYYTLNFFDLNQDGLSDVCGIGPAGLSCYYTLRNNAGSTSFSAATVYNQIARVPPAGLPVWDETSLDFHQLVPTLMPMNLNRARDLALCARGLPTGSGGTNSSNGHLMCIVPTSGGATTASMFDLDMTALGNNLPDWRTVRLVDINGDGWSDMCAYSATSSACVKNNGQGGLAGMNSFSGFVSAVSSETASNGMPTANFWESVVGYDWLHVEAINANGAEPAANTPEWTYYHVKKAAKGSPNYSTLRYVDVNADGLPDVCERAPDGFHCRVQRRLSSNWVCQQALNATHDSLIEDRCDGANIWGQSGLNPPFNTADGYMDVFAYRIDLPIAWSDWTATLQPTHWDLPQHFQTIDMVDVTGDGLPDVCGRDINGIKCYASEKSPRDLVAAVADGYGQQTAITYKPLTDSTIYKRGTVAAYPNLDLQPGMLVVSAVDVSNGVGGSNRMSYRYENLIAHVDFGSQGFGLTEVRDETAGRLTTTTFRQTFPYTGMPIETREYHCPTALTPAADCFLMKQKTLGNWGQKNVLPAPYTGILPYVTTSTEKQWDLPSGAAVGTGGALVASSSTTLSVSANPVAAGVSVQLSAQVSNGLPTSPAGTVTFVADGYGTLGSATLSGGTATLNTSFATIGTRNLRAVYSGDSASGGSTSVITSLVVNTGAASVAVTTNPSGMAARGQSVTITATATGNAPTGSVTFKDGSTVLGTAALNVNGVAALVTSWAVDGTHNLKVAYSGDANNAALESAVNTLTVGTITPTVTLATAMSPATVNQPTTLTATVSGYSPTGSVTFRNGSTVLGTANLDATGVATYTTADTSLLPAGNASLVADYAGDSKNAAASSSAQSLTVGKGTLSIGPDADPRYVSIGTPTTLIATMYNSSVPAIIPPVGSVTFKEGSTTLGTGSLVNAVARMSSTYTWSAAGSKSLTFSYPGDSNYNAATYSFSYEVASSAPTVTISSDYPPPATITASTMLTLTATVNAGSGNASPQGTVIFKDGATVVGTVALPSGSGGISTAALPARKFDAGNRAFTATFISGDTSPIYATKTSGVMNLSVNKASPQLSVSAPSSAEVGAPVTLTSTLTNASAAPGGGITFQVNNATIGSAVFVGTTATLQTTFSILGSNIVTALYTNGDANNNEPLPATAPATTVTKRATALVLTPSVTEATSGQTVTITATVTGGTGGLTPTGNVTLTKDGQTYQSATLSAAGTCAFSVTAGTASMSFSASYPGDNWNNPATTSANTNVLVRTVTPTLTFVPANTTVGQAQSATVTVTGSNPTGTVTIKEGSTTLGSGTLSGGTVVVSLSPPTTAGVHNLTALYGGDTVNLPASASASATVAQQTSGIALAVTPNPSSKNQPITMTATVTGYQPTGLVTFMNGSLMMGQAYVTANTATVSMIVYATGTYALSAIYAGDTNNTGATSSVVNQVVNNSSALTVSLAVTPSPAVAGQQVMLNAALYTGGVAPSGSVTFKQGSTVLGTASVQGSAGSWYAQLPYTFATAGTYNLTAEYSGAAGSATSAASGLVVTRPQPALQLVSSVETALASQSVTLTATISGDNPTGSITFKDSANTLGTAVISGGVATLTTSFGTASTKTLTAEYAGDTNNGAAISAAIPLDVVRYVPTLALVVSPASMQVGQTVTLTATLSGGYQPTGNIEFRASGVPTPLVVPLNNGVATISSVVAGISNYTITASYAGDSNNEAAVSTPQTMTATQATPTLTLSASQNPATRGSSVTLTGTLSNGSVATGQLVFKDGATVLGTSNGISNGVGTRTVTFADAGVHNLTVEYAGDTNYAAATGSLALTVNMAAPIVTLTANPSAPGMQQSVTLSAALSGSYGTPSGTVTFMDGATTLGTGTVSSGVATLTTTFTTMGSKSLTANYGGDANYATATGNLSLTISQAVPTVALSLSPAVILAGGSSTLTATLGGGVTPSGSVTFKDGATTLGTGNISGNVATLSKTFSVAGFHSLTAVYGGDTNNASVTSAVTSLAVGPVPTQIVLSTNPANPVVGTNVIPIATITGANPSGNIDIYQLDPPFDDMQVGGGTIVNGVAQSYPVVFFNTGTYTLYAKYWGDSYNNASDSPQISVTVAKASPSISLATTPTTGAVGGSVTLQATLSGSYSPSGTVTFKDGSTTLGTGAVNGSGVATFATTFSTAGTKNLTAVYNGDTNNNTATSSAVALSVIAKTSPTLTLTAANNPAVTSQSVTLTATLGGAYGTPSGTVTFKDGSTTLGTGTVSGGVATFSASFSTTGTKSLTAVYGGDYYNNTATSSAYSLTVMNKVTPTIARTVTPNPAAITQPVTMTATLSGGYGTVSGTVTFKDGSTTLGTGTVSGGVATYTGSFSTAGTKSITAVYGGDYYNNTVTSSAFSLTVSAKVTPTITLTATPNPAAITQSVTMTATLGGGFNPSGTVTFKNGTTVLGTGTVSNGVATYTGSFSTTGTKSLTAVYGGDTYNNTVTSSAFSLTVASKVTPTIALTVTPNPVVHAQNITMTATLGGGFNPSGTVTFKRGTTSLGSGTISNGVATLTVVGNATAGTFSMTAVYNGDTYNNTVTSSATSLTVTAVFRAVKDWFYAWFDGEDPPANDASPSTQQEAA